MAEFIFDGEEEAQAACDWWQGRLGLADWDVVCRIKRRDDMGTSAHQGEVHPTIGNKQALIRILDPIDYPADCVFPNDHEDTLVHELNHLVLARVKLEEGNIDLEQSISALTKALIGFRRLAYPEVPWGDSKMAKKCKGKGKK